MKMSSLQFTYICILHFSIMFSHVAPPPLRTMHWEIENQQANNTFFIVSSAEKRGLERETI